MPRYQSRQLVSPLIMDELAPCVRFMAAAWLSSWRCCSQRRSAGLRNQAVPGVGARNTCAHCRVFKAFPGVFPRASKSPTLSFVSVRSKAGWLAHKPHTRLQAKETGTGRGDGSGARKGRQTTLEHARGAQGLSAHPQREAEQDSRRAFQDEEPHPPGKVCADVHMECISNCSLCYA